MSRRRSTGLSRLCPWQPGTIPLRREEEEDWESERGRFRKGQGILPGTYIYFKPTELICSCNRALGPDWPPLPRSVIHTSFFLSRSLLVPLSISHFLPFRGYPSAISLLSVLCVLSVFLSLPIKFHSYFFPFMKI